MIWGTGNLGRGVGGASLYGMILVNYPEGSNVTISGGRAGKREITSSQILYYIKDPGTYSITANNGVQTRTKSVTISTFGQSEKINIVYSLDLYKPGDTSGWTVMGWKYNAASSSGTVASAPQLTYRTNDMVIAQNSYHSGITYHAQVDVTEFSSLICTCSFSGWNSTSNGLFLMYNVNGNGSYHDNAAASTKVTAASGNMRLVIDVSSRTGTYYPAIATARDSMTSTFYITGIWLE